MRQERRAAPPLGSNDGGQLLLLAALLMTVSILVVGSIIVSYGSIGVLSSSESTNQLSAHFIDVRNIFPDTFLYHIETLRNPKITPEVVDTAFDRTLESIMSLESEVGIGCTAILLKKEMRRTEVVSVTIFMEISDGKDAMCDTFMIEMAT